MKHPNQETLALHAGGDLGWVARWKTERHLAKCGECREEIGAFRGVREIATELSEIPEVPWTKLAAEMKANIRLGLAAGEIVGGGEKALRENPWFTGARAAVALASMVVLVFTGLVLESPKPAPVKEEARVVGTMANGIQISADGQSLAILNSGAGEVNYSASAQAAVRASYVDSDGYVKVNSVYGQ